MKTEFHEISQKQGARITGLSLAILAITLILVPSFGNFSNQQKSVAAFLTGMFGFTSIEAFRRSF